MSTTFDVRRWATQAGIQTAGGFAVIAECVTMDELQRFAEIAIASAGIDAADMATAACRDAETIGEEAEDWAFGNSTANSRMIDAQQAAPQQEAQEPCQTCAALARTVMLDQVSFDRKPDCYGIRQVTDDEGIEEWEDIRTSPDVAREEANDMMATGRGEIYEVVPLYTAPQPAPVAQADAEDAALWRALAKNVEEISGGDSVMSIDLCADSKPEQHLVRLLAQKVAALNAARKQGV